MDLILVFSRVSQIGKFLLTGGLSTGAQYLTIAGIISSLTLPASVASGLGYIVGSVVNYTLNYVYTFSSSVAHQKALVRFYSMVVIGWAINTGLVLVLVDISQLSMWPAQVFSTLCVLVWNFLVSKFFVFKG